MIKLLRDFFEYRASLKQRSLGAMCNEVAVTADPSPRLAKRAEPLSRPHDVPTTTISILNAINGRVLEIGTYKHNPHGPDWTYEHFIVAEGESVETAMSAILLMKGMK